MVDIHEVRSGHQLNGNHCGSKRKRKRSEHPLRLGVSIQPAPYSLQAPCVRPGYMCSQMTVRRLDDLRSRHGGDKVGGAEWVLCAASATPVSDADRRTPLAPLTLHGTATACPFNAHSSSRVPIWRCIARRRRAPVEHAERPAFRPLSPTKSGTQPAHRVSAMHRPRVLGMDRERVSQDSETGHRRERRGEGRPCPITGRPREERRHRGTRLRTGVLQHVLGPYMSGRSTGPEPKCLVLGSPSSLRASCAGGTAGLGQTLDSDCA